MKASGVPIIKRAIAAAAGSLLIFGSANDASADALRLRGDALVQSQSPVGLLVMRGEDRFHPWIDAEAVAWLGARTTSDTTGDVQTLMVRIRDPRGRGELRVGRFVFASGAIRPTHVDGARAYGRAPWGTALEVFGGAPVAPRMGSRMYDVAYGGRVSQSIGSWISVGGAYVQRVKGSSVIDKEAGPDLFLSPTRWLDIAGRMAFDLVNKGPADALASVGAHKDDLRLEGFVTHRSPGRLLPSTSLFTVLGDFAATTTGGTLRYKIAPRLDLVGTGGVIMTTQDTGLYYTGRATLALDDDAKGTVGFEVRRQEFGKARWFGARAVTSVPLSASLRGALELELVRPDDQQGRVRLWPWALASVAYHTKYHWNFGGAVEVLGTRDDRTELHALARATYAIESLR